MSQSRQVISYGLITLLTYTMIFPDMHLLFGDDSEQKPSLKTLQAVPPEKSENPSQKTTETQPLGKAWEKYPVQILDEPLKPFQPVKKRTAKDQKKLDSLTWFMTARLLEKRRKFKSAYDAYKKSAELNPNESEIYKVLATMALRLNKADEFEKYAVKAVELNPSDFDLLRSLGVHFARRNRIPEAVNIIEQAISSEELDKQSASYIIMCRDLAILYGAIQQLQKASEKYEVIFDALQHPEKYALEASVRRRLQTEATTSPETIGKIFLETKKYEKAIAAFKMAADQRNGNPGTLSYYIAQVHMKMEQPAQALKELKKYLDAQLQTKGREPYEMLETILDQLKKKDELLPTLRGYAEKDVRNHFLQYFLAEQYIVADQLDEAKTIYERSLKGIGDPIGFRGLASIFRKQNHFEEYLQTLSKALPRSLDTSVLDKELAEAGKDEKLISSLIEHGNKQQEKLGSKEVFLIARLAAEGGKNKDSIAFFQRALKQTRGAGLGEIYSGLGSSLLMEERFAEASTNFETAANDPALSDRRLDFLFRLSQSRELNGETEKALTAIREAQKAVNNGIPLLVFQEGWIFYHARQWDKAIPIFEKLIAQFGSNSDSRTKNVVRRAQSSLSNIFVLQGNLEKGMAILEKIYNEDPNDPSVNNDLGYLYADNDKHLEKAEKMVQKALDAEPENGAYLDSMGWVKYKLGKYQEAFEYLEKASKTESGDDPTIQDHFADVYLKLNKKQKAIELWKKALSKAKKEKYPDEKLIKNIEEKLKKHAGDEKLPQNAPSLP